MSFCASVRFFKRVLSPFSSCLKITSLLLLCLGALSCGGGGGGGSQSNTVVLSEAEKLSKAKQLVAEVEQWEGVFSFEQQELALPHPFQNPQMLLEPDIATALQALVVAGQWGALAALPQIGTTSLCASLKNPLYASICTTLVSTMGLETLCDEAVSKVQTFGIDICALINNIPLPVAKNLVVRYHLFDETVEVTGSLGGAEVNLTLGVNGRTTNQLKLDITGDIEAEFATLTFSDGVLVFDFPDGFDVKQLKLPSAAAFSGSVDYVQLASDSTVPVSFKGTLSGDIDLSELIETEGVGLFGLAVGVFEEGDAVALNFTIDGEYEDENQVFNGALTVNQDHSGEFSVVLDLLSGNGEEATLKLAGDLTEIASQRFDGEIQYGQKTLNVDFFGEGGLSVTDAEGAELLLSFSGRGLNEDRGFEGEVLFGGSALGSISKEGTRYKVTFIDESTYYLSGF